MHFSQVDVFTAELMYGNPVAVAHDGAALSDEQMAAFARWTNLSETTYLLPPTDPAADYRLRIFTPFGELPFAGHPTLGSARAWLAAGGVPAQDGRLVQECAAGLVRIRDRDGRLAFAAPPLRRGGPVDEADIERLASGLGLARADVVDAQWADNGPGWIALLLASADAVLAVDPSGLPSTEKVGIVGPCASGSPTDFEVRAFFPGGEDPVTGSLNAGIAQWLIGSGRTPDSYIASQGTKLGRRGRVHVDRLGDDIWIGGETVVGITGEVAL